MGEKLSPANLEIIQHLVDNPELTYSDEARLKGLTRERIRQIAMGTPAERHKIIPTCKTCGMPIEGAPYSIRRNGLCATHWAEAKQRRKQQNHAAHHQTYNCDICGQKFERFRCRAQSANRHGSNTRFCKKPCRGNKKLVLYLYQHPGATLEEMERYFRVSQIILLRLLKTHSTLIKKETSPQLHRGRPAFRYFLSAKGKKVAERYLKEVRQDAYR